MASSLCDTPTWGGQEILCGEESKEMLDRQSSQSEKSLSVGKRVKPRLCCLARAMHKALRQGTVQKFSLNEYKKGPV